MAVGLTRTALLRWLALTLLAGSATLAQAGQNIFYFTSDPGDYIGGGQEVVYTDLEAAFTAYDNYGGGVSASVTTPGFEHWWYLDFVPATGTLQVGTYPLAERFPFQQPGHPGLSVSGDGRGCNTLTGQFTVRELVRDTVTGQIQAFAIDYEQHCEGFQPALYGQIRFNSDVPISGRPIRLNLEPANNYTGCVEAQGPAGTAITARVLGLTDVNGGSALRYDWITTSGASGQGDTFSFVAPYVPGNFEPTLLTLNVTDLISQETRTVARSICVADTVAPEIRILRPLPGEQVVGDDLILDVVIRDTVDKGIAHYDVFTGTSYRSPLNLKTGRAIQNLIEKPRADGSIQTTITVRATDAAGNPAEQTVTVTRQVKKGR
jgi:hypothetical protein